MSIVHYQWMCCMFIEWQWMWYPNITTAGCEIKTDKNSSTDYYVMAVLLDFQPITDHIIISVLWLAIQSLLDEKGKRLSVWTCVFLAVRDKDGPQGFIHCVHWFWMNQGGNIKVWQKTSVLPESGIIRWDFSKPSILPTCPLRDFRTNSW